MAFDPSSIVEGAPASASGFDPSTAQPGDLLKNPGMLEDSKDAFLAELPRLAASAGNAGRSLLGGFAGIGNKLGIVPDSSKDALDDPNVEAIGKNNQIEEEGY